MWFKRDVNILVESGNHDEAVLKLCKKFGIGIQHAEDIIRELDQYQWHVRRLPNMDKKVKKFLAENNIVGAAKLIREVTDWGLLQCKFYIEDVRDKRKPWPTPQNEEGEQ